MWKTQNKIFLKNVKYFKMIKNIMQIEENVLYNFSTDPWSALRDRYGTPEL